MLPSGTQAKLNIPCHLEPAPRQCPVPTVPSQGWLPMPNAGPRPSPPVPGTIKAQPTGQLKAECFLQVGTAITVDNLPEMQAAVIQQGQEAALGGVQRPRLGW